MNDRRDALAEIGSAYTALRSAMGGIARDTTVTTLANARAVAERVRSETRDWLDFDLDALRAEPSRSSPDPDPVRERVEATLAAWEREPVWTRPDVAAAIRAALYVESIVPLGSSPDPDLPCLLDCDCHFDPELDHGSCDYCTGKSEQERSRLGSSPDLTGLDERVHQWVKTRATTEWTPGFSGDFRRGYDAAHAEVAALIGENIEP